MHPLQPRCLHYNLSSLLQLNRHNYFTDLYISQYIHTVHKKLSSFSFCWSVQPHSMGSLFPDSHINALTKTDISLCNPAFLHRACTILSEECYHLMTLHLGSFLGIHFLKTRGILSPEIGISPLCISSSWGRIFELLHLAVPCQKEFCLLNL